MQRPSTSTDSGTTSISPVGIFVFLLERSRTVPVTEMVDSQFESFIRRNVLRYDVAKYPMNAVGSVGACFSENLARAAERTGVRIGRVIKSPIDSLVEFHSADL